MISSSNNTFGKFKLTAKPLTCKEYSHDANRYKVYDCLQELPALRVMKVRYLEAVEYDHERVDTSPCKTLSSFQAVFTTYG